MKLSTASARRARLAMPTELFGRVRLMVTVKAYPNISQRHGEVVCVAGIRTDQAQPAWVRLWPVQFRDLAFADRFEKYQEITVDAAPSHKDDRPESLRPRTDTLSVGQEHSTRNRWAARRRWVEPLIVDSMCEVLDRQEKDGSSLAVIRPGTVHDLVIEAMPAGWTPGQQSVIDQPSLFAPDKSQLEAIPYRFKYRYTCSRDGCKGHEQSIIDWELGQAFRNWSPDDATQRLALIRKKWLDEICGSDKETLFFVGNIHMHPRSFVVLGTFWPPKEPATDQLNLSLGS
jgi:hypothetical protein